jgi:hypothetical protein
MATRLERPQTWQKTLPILISLTEDTIATNSVIETVVSAVLAIALEETDLPFHEAIVIANATSAKNQAAGQLNTLKKSEMNLANDSSTALSNALSNALGNI